MVLDIELLTKLTGLKDKYIILYNEKDWMEIADVLEDEVGKVLFAKGRMSTEVKKLIDLVKLLLNFVSKTLIPRAGSFEKLYPSDLLLTFHLVVGRKKKRRKCLLEILMLRLLKFFQI
ncbi:hypothetical protein SESBI_36350 [Sesbania bispinosa]|nr:hypothetical protein SESBI_36350 [Sesbania bispinosa]